MGAAAQRRQRHEREGEQAVAALQAAERRAARLEEDRAELQQVSDFTNDFTNNFTDDFTSARRVSTAFAPRFDRAAFVLQSNRELQRLVDAARAELLEPLTGDASREGPALAALRSGAPLRLSAAARAGEMAPRARDGRFRGGPMQDGVSAAAWAPAAGAARDRWAEELRSRCGRAARPPAPFWAQPLEGAGQRFSGGRVAWVPSRLSGVMQTAQDGAR